MINYAKVKDGKIITYPYAFDELHNDFSEMNVKGTTIDIMELFLRHNQSDCELVEVYNTIPRSYDNRVEKAYLEETPVFEDGKWIHKWIVEPLDPMERSKLIQEESK